MKKLLSLLGAVGLIATSSATVVACGDPDKGTANTDEKDYSDPITYTIDDLLGQFSTKDDDGTYIMNDAVKQWSTDDDWDGAIAVLSIDLLVGLTYNGRDRITETIEDMAISVQPVDSNLPKIDNPDKPDKPKAEIVDGETYTLTYSMDEDFIDEDTNATVTKADFTIQAVFNLTDIA